MSKFAGLRKVKVASRTRDPQDTHIHKVRSDEKSGCIFDSAGEVINTYKTIYVDLVTK